MAPLPERLDYVAAVFIIKAVVFGPAEACLIM
jgi:hypothetical protein